ncbi:MAG: type I-B CRISPR-associated protein Cas7/Cst2/DevR [Bacteroidales bacterium]|nr:type I-B CRISPR-associated protein Cas7/Cst2/DevR [Bacteroidales bacterium]MCF8337678.1 type I-B CRISPR-associated protein Cas7/Cst2/DevR [Bacteroidales bacterium]
MAQGLTFTVVFKAMSMNYGESLGNISELKKLNSGNNTYTYMSRQALRYELYKALTENFQMDKDQDNPLDSEQQVVQFKSDTTAAKYAEADLFGYMKTERNRGALIRPAVVRITPAIALEPYLNDIEFGTNKNFADRAGEDPNPFQFEHQLSLYSYTITIDLDKIGIDENDGDTIEDKKKYKRVAMVLDSIQILNREIKGRIENLNPLFVVGGIYPVKNPFFLGRIKTTFDQDKKAYKIDTDLIDSVMGINLTIGDSQFSVKEKTKVGFVSNYWSNEAELRGLVNASDNISINSFFESIKNELKEYYEID